MANVIKPKRSNTASNVPTTANTTSGELAVNMADKKIYINNGTSIVQVGAGTLPALSGVVITTPATNQVLQYNGTNWINATASGSGTVTSITAGTGLSGGTITTTGTIALANTAVTAGSYTTANITVDAQGRITAASSGTSGVSSVTGTAPIASSGGTTPAISISQATTSTNGYLSSTDWNTFNNKTSNTGTVTSVGGTGTVSGLSLSGTVTTSGNLTLGGTLAVTASNFASQTANTFLSAPNGAAGVPTFRAIVAADIPTLNQNTTGTAATITGVYSGTITSGQITTGLGFTPYNATNPNSYIALGSAITGYTAGANTALAATDTLLAALGKLQGQVSVRGTGTVTSVGGTGTVSGLSLSGTVTTTGNLTLGGTLAVTASNFASQTANQVLIAPNGVAGVPTFRALLAADVPTLNQNTTGSSGSCTGNAATATTAVNVTGTVAIANGGTGATTAGAALTALGAYAASNPSGYTSNTGTVTSIIAGTGLSGGTITTTGTIALANTTVTAGSFTNASITVDAQGRLTAASSGAGSSGTVTSVGGTGTVAGITLTGTVTTSGSLTLGGTFSLPTGQVTTRTLYQSFTATAAQTTFTPTTAYTASKIDVYCNGVKMRNATDVTVTSGTSVVFATGLAVGSLVDLVYPT